MFFVIFALLVLAVAFGVPLQYSVIMLYEAYTDELVREQKMTQYDRLRDEESDWSEAAYEFTDDNDDDDE